MLHHADGLKIRVDYFYPKRALPSVDWRGIGSIATHRFTLHASMLVLTVLGAAAAVLN